MDIYNIWFNAKPSVGDLMLVEKVGAYLNYLRQQNLIEAWRLTRRKLGLGPSHLGDFHLMIEVRNLRQLDDAFAHVATRRDPVEALHHGLNSLVNDAIFALYRDFPDPVRHHGEEKF